MAPGDIKGTCPFSDPVAPLIHGNGLDSGQPPNAPHERRGHSCVYLAVDVSRVRSVR
jgi:hypothetical protein